MTSLVSNQNIVWPQSPMLDKSGRLTREWALWFQNPNLASLSLTNAIGVSSGGTGTGAIPTNGQLLIGNGTGYSLNTLTAGSGIGVANAAGSITISNAGVTSIAAGPGIFTSASSGAVTVTNADTTLLWLQ